MPSSEEASLRSLLVIVLSRLGVKVECCYGTDGLVFVGKVEFGRAEVRWQHLIPRQGEQLPQQTSKLQVPVGISNKPWYF